MGIYVGGGLLILAVFLILAGNFSRKREVTMKGSVSVGGDNHGSIFNVNQIGTSTKSSSNWLSLLGILVGLVGIGVTMWDVIQGSQ